MLVEKQKIEVRWNGSNRKWYEEKGYKFTKIRDGFIVKPEDLPDYSHHKVEVICDFCNRQYILEYRDYLKNIKRNNKKFHCFICGNRKHIKNINHSTSKNKLSVDEVIKRIESKNKNKLLNPEDYKNQNTSNLKVLCGSCGSEFLTSLSSIKNGDGACLKCANKKTSEKQKLSSEEVKRRIDAVNNNKLLNPKDYRDNHTPNLKIKCGDCGEIYVTTLANYEYNQKIRCDKCSQRISVPERKVMELLNFYSINYKYNYRFSDCKGKNRALPFDFWIEDLNTIIETDGRHHYHSVWGEEHFQRTKLYDGIKDKYCKNKNIQLIRIPYWEFDNIEDILIKKLNLKPLNQNKKIKYIPKKKIA
ncbi:hypothetical protein H8S37_04725 [Mediterraneibacter sp. NSJ-55]|uniref:DUF559 domain-containing protein n=1 Tax=Mediterraneibacter hominis TaxID=2763054 RepID=A0A923RQ29_9FIRM|nr:hypothetical protein [Mediterraneibacter hominis]MBC5688233.1 hypothetical protein [Mediterraneibacter hominis]